MLVLAYLVVFSCVVMTLNVTFYYVQIADKMCCLLKGSFLSYLVSYIQWAKTTVSIHLDIHLTIQELCVTAYVYT